MGAYTLVAPVTDKPSVPVERFRRNDYVGSPIWGFRGMPPGMELGDRAHYEFRYLGEKTVRIDYVLTLINDRPALVEAKPMRDGTYQFAGFFGGER